MLFKKKKKKKKKKRICRIEYRMTDTKTRQKSRNSGAFFFIFSLFLPRIPKKKKMSLIECIQDQASYYQRLTAELDRESNVDDQLENAIGIRQQLGKAIENKKAEINSLEQSS
jgi:hypothetical protein